MKKINTINTIYQVNTTSRFDKQLKKVIKQGKDIEKLIVVVEKLANKEPLDISCKDHQLINDKTYKECRECHITPNWLLVYKYVDDELILVLFSTGSHSELFNM